MSATPDPSPVRRIRRVLLLTEQKETGLSADELTVEEARAIIERYGRAAFSIQAPSALEGNDWHLRPDNTVGFFPVTTDLAIEVRPKVPIANIFRMFEYAYDLQSLQVVDDLTHCDSFEEFYSRLAEILAKRVLQRSRRGFYRSYARQEESTTFVRGRVDLARRSMSPWKLDFDCSWEDHTSDIEENQILLWTLHAVGRNGALLPRVAPIVRKAHHAVGHAAILKPFDASACIGRLYNRLNDDYTPLHALCRFFLEHTGPTGLDTDRRVLPFRVDMALLFEKFVARWLKAHLALRYQLRYQENVSLGSDSSVRFAIDMVLHDSETGQDICVLDAKYKDVSEPSSDDVQQVMAYAHVMETKEAVLVYPTRLPRPFEVRPRDIRVRTLALSLGGDLERAGDELIESLVGEC